MGYYSQMTTNDMGGFRLREGKSIALWETVMQRVIAKDGYMDLYEKIMVPDAENPTLFHLDIEDIWESKHYSEEKLAALLAQFIHPDDPLVLYFNGEDGAHWGRFIHQGRVREIEATWKFVDGVRLVDDELRWIMEGRHEH